MKTLMKLRKLSSSLVEVYDISQVSGVSLTLEISELSPIAAIRRFRRCKEPGLDPPAEMQEGEKAKDASK